MIPGTTPLDGAGARRRVPPTRPRPRPGPAGRAGLLLLAAWVASLAGPAVRPLTAQIPPPDGTWLTFRTEHFRVTYEQGLEPLARRAARVAERAHAVLREELAPAPAGPIELVVTDHVDFTNGYATPFTSNRIVVFARPPLDLAQLAFARDWIELVVVHELVHIFHMDVAGPVGRAIRSVFGRMPMVWPVFPVVGTPGWNLEGLATHYESRLTGGGRAHGSFHDMIVRMAALEEGIPRLRDVSTPSPVWPAGQRDYVYGAELMDWVAEEYGAEVHSRLIRATADAPLPTFLVFDRVARDATGRGFRSLYDQWRGQAADSARAVAARLETEGVTRPETVMDRGPYAASPRLSPDGAHLAYAAHDFRTSPATRLVDLGTGQVRTLARRNQFGAYLGPASWLPGGAGLVAAQLEFRGPFRLHSDLWRLDTDGRERRLTRGARLSQPDAAPDGRRVAVIRAEDGALHLAVHDLSSGRTADVARAAPGGGWATPRWSPDGGRIAAARYLDGRVDIVVLDPATGAMTAVTDDDALDVAPAWSTDGRWLLFWSDRSGIPNIYAADMMGDRPLRQVTNMIGGAFDPEVSPDGAWLYFSSYYSGGFRLERIPFDPGTWRDAPPSVMAYEPSLLRLRDPPPPTPAVDATRGVDAPARPYSPWSTLRPYYWLPSFEETGLDPNFPENEQALRFWGLYSSGWDTLQRHLWTGTLGVDPGSGRIQGDLQWAWQGLGNPVLTLRLGQDWFRAGTIQVGSDAPEALYLRERRAALEALFLRQRWRSAAWVIPGVETIGRAFEPHASDARFLQQVGVAQPQDLVALTLRPGFTTARQHPFSISLEDGITASLASRFVWRADDLRPAYEEYRGRLTGYRAFPWWGFANHVLAGRVSGLVRTGPRTFPSAIGGAAGTPSDVLIGTIGGGPLLLPVRGFGAGAKYGNHAWTASGEYRFPLQLRGYRPEFLGLSIASVAGAVFVDAGDATCRRVPREAPGRTLCTDPGAPALLATGGELSFGFGILHGVPLRVRAGLAAPLRGPDVQGLPLHPADWQAYIRFGSAF